MDIVTATNGTGCDLAKSLDIPARKVTARYELAGCEGPTGIAYAAADKLLISSCDGVAEVVAAETGKVVRRIKIGDGADGVAYDASRHLAFIPAGMAGTLSVISVSHGDATLIDERADQTRRGGPIPRCLCCRLSESANPRQER